MNIENFGVSKRCRIAKELFLKAVDGLHLVFLPIPTSKDTVHVSGTQTPVCGIVDEVREDTLVVGYAIPDALRAGVLEKGGRILDLNLDERFQRENARISAQGALGYILSGTERCVFDMKIGIVGYGRIGRELLFYLLALGADVRVFTTSESSAASLGEKGIAVELYRGGVRNFDGLDMLINTAPTDLSGSFRDGTVPDGMRVIDLASGENFKGISGVERLPSIPETMYPLSGGNAYFKAIKRYISEDKED